MIFKAKFFDELNVSELYEILRSRCEIFTLEQRIYYQDIDGIDREARHIFIEDNGRVVAYMRAFFQPDGDLHIGRVLTLEHGKGLGIELMKKGLKDISENMRCDRIVLNSQTHAVGFYERFGFRAVSDEFLEAGIPHITMELKTR